MMNSNTPSTDVWFVAEAVMSVSKGVAQLVVLA